MATYRELHGKAVKTVTTNPTDEAAEGQIWFNSTDNTFKSAIASAAWSSTAPIPAKTSASGGAGTQTAGLIFGGYDGDASDETNRTLEYNGSGFTTSGNLNQARSGIVGFGTQTAAVGACGYNNAFPGASGFLTNSEEYDGSSWTAGNAAGTQVHSRSSAGILTAGVIVGGRLFGSTATANSEEYDGTSYSEGNNLSTGRWGLGGAGTQTAAIFFGGRPQNSPFVVTANSETYDGTSYSSGPSLNTSRGEVMGIGDAQTSVLACGGFETAPSVTGKTESFDGTSFSETADLGTNRRSAQLHGAGASNASALMAGGYNGSTQVTNSEEFNVTASTITAGAWSAGGNLNTARYQLAGAGSTPAGLVFGGRKETAPSANYNNSEEYNGTSWTEGNNLNTARFGLYGIGTQTAGLACGGRTTPAVVDNSEEYDGTSYTEGNNLASARHNGGSAGTQTAGLIFKGTNVTAPGPANMTTTSQSYDGTSWTATNSCNTARLINYGFGTQTAAISVGGNPFATSGESFDGTNWTAISGTLNDGRQQGFSGGTSTNGLVCGGNSPPNTTNVEAYNGTIFATAPSLSTARRAMAGTPGTSVPTGVFGAGGYTSTELNSTEEFTPESTSLNIETLTQS